MYISESIIFTCDYKPAAEIVTGELFWKINGHPYDSPNAHLAYNALYSMGIYPNVLVEEDMHNWRDTTFEEAFSRAKRRLIVNETSEYDDLIQEALAQRLTPHDGVYIWPEGCGLFCYGGVPGNREALAENDPVR